MMKPEIIGATEDTETAGGSELSADAALEVIGFGRFQALMMVICGMAWFVDSVEVGGMAYIYVTLDKEWGTDTASWGLLNSLKSVASVLGALGFGMTADRFGRRPAFLGALTLTSISGLACGAVSSFGSLLLLRCVTNVGAGGILPAGISLLAEHLPPSRRESCVVFMQIFFTTGHVLAVLMSMLLVPGGHWRFFLLTLAGPPTLLLLLVARVLPETPVFLQQSGQREQAQEALNRICKFNGGRGWGASVPQEPSHAAEEALTAEPKRGLAWILSRRGLVTRVVLFGLLWSCTMTASDWATWVTEIGDSHGFSEHSIATFMIILKGVGVTGFLLAASCAQGGRGPRVLRGALAISTAAALCCAAVIGNRGPAALIGSVVCLTLAYDMVWALLYATTAAAFDPLCRASALSIATCFSRAAAAVVPLISGPLLVKHESFALLFWALGWACATLLAMFINFTEFSGSPPTHDQSGGIAEAAAGG